MSTQQRVVPRSAENHIIKPPAIDDIISLCANQCIITAAAGNRIIPRPADDPGVPHAACDAVVATATKYPGWKYRLPQCNQVISIAHMRDKPIDHARAELALKPIQFDSNAQ